MTDRPEEEPRLSGAEHYRRAELLLESCRPGAGSYDEDTGDGISEHYGPVDGDEPGVDTCRNALMAAQVHATLAVAAGLRSDFADTPAEVQGF